MFNIESIETSIENNMRKETGNLSIKKESVDIMFKQTMDFKNHFYFENLSDDQFFDIAGAKNEFVSFYKKIIKSGVSSIILGGVYLGLNEKSDNNLSRISLEDNIMSAYKKIIKNAHSFGCKVYLQVKSIYGRFNHLNNHSKQLKRASNFGLDPENKSKVLIRISDNKCTELINDLSRISILSNIAGFDGLVIDASFNNIIGELTSAEYNKRIFGYYSNTNDFIKKALKQIDVKNNTIILKLSVMSLFYQDTKNAFLCKNNKNFSIKHLLENIKEFIELGVDGFEFLFGAKENEFLNIFNNYQDEMIFKEFYIAIRKYLTENNIKNKFGDDIIIFCHDNNLDFSKTNLLVQNNIINFIDITREIYSDLNFIKNLYIQKNAQKCIKCGYCNQKIQLSNKIECLINPSLINIDDMNVNGKGKTIAVIGSGISGLICSLTLTLRGYNVHIYEQKNELNPIGRLTTIYGFETLLSDYYNYIETQIKNLEKKKQIQIFFNHKFTTEDLSNSYHAVVVATGFKAKLLTIVGAVQAHVFNIFDVLKNKNILSKKKNIVIYAKSELSLKLANYLLEIGHENVTIIIKDISFVQNEKSANLSYLFYNLYKNHANIMFFAKIIKINEDNIEVNFCPNISPNSVKSYLKIWSNDKLNFDRRQQNLDCDLLIYEPDIIPNNTLYTQIVSENFLNEVYLIGNALENNNLAEQIKSGYYVGKNI